MQDAVTSVWWPASRSASAQRQLPVGADIRADRDEALTVAVYKRHCSLRSIVGEAAARAAARARLEIALQSQTLLDRRA